MIALDETLAALADPARRAVIDQLRRGPRSAGDLARRAGTSASTMSRHLRLLRECGLIDDERDEEDARVRLFSLRRKPFRDLGQWLEKVEGFWDDQLASFKAHAERRK